MAAQPDGFLVNGDLVGKYGGFRYNTAFVNSGRAENLVELLEQPLPVLCNSLGCAFLNYADKVFNILQLQKHIVPQLFAFAHTHGVEILKSLLCD